jgi:hypothetical protein
VSVMYRPSSATAKGRAPARLLRDYVSNLRSTYSLLASERTRFALARSMTSARSLTWASHELALAQYEHGSCYRMDLYVRLLAIEHWAGANDFGFDLYERFIASKSLTQGRAAPSHTVDGFVRLIQNIHTGGFASGGRIAMGADKVLHHGVHRLACALFLAIPRVPVVIERSWARRPDYTLERLRELGLSNRDIDAVRAAESRYTSKWRGGR